MSARCSVLVPFLLAGALAAALTSCGGASSGSTGDEDAAAYDDVDAIAEMTDAVRAQDFVRLTLGTKKSPDDIIMDTTVGATERSFRAVTGGDPALQVDIRVVDDRVYVGGELVGNQWTYVAVDDPRLTGKGDFDAGIVPPLLDIDVVGDNEALAAAVKDTALVGTEEIDGIETDHHLLTVDTTEWSDALPKGSIFRKMDLPDTVEMDLYLDRDSLPVRLTYEVPDHPEQSAQVSYTRWGTPIEVTVPPRSQPVS